MIATLLANLIYNRIQDQKKCLKYDLITKLLFNIANLDIRVNDNQVTQISHSRIIFRNEGGIGIYDSDIIGDFINICIKKTSKFIYSENISKDKENIRLITEENKIKIKFYQLLKHEEIILDLYHTGNSNADIVIKGQIKNQKEIERREYIPIITTNLLPNNKKPLIRSLYITIITAFIAYTFDIHLYTQQLLKNLCGICLNEFKIMILICVLSYCISLTIQNYRYWYGMKNITNL